MMYNKTFRVFKERFRDKSLRIQPEPDWDAHICDPARYSYCLNVRIENELWKGIAVLEESQPDLTLEDVIEMLKSERLMHIRLHPRYLEDGVAAQGMLSYEGTTLIEYEIKEPW